MVDHHAPAAAGKLRYRKHRSRLGGKHVCSRLAGKLHPGPLLVKGFVHLAVYGRSQRPLCGQVEKHQHGFGHQIAHKRQTAKRLVQINLHRQRALHALNRRARPRRVDVFCRQQRQQKRARNGAVAKQPLAKGQPSRLRAAPGKGAWAALALWRGGLPVQSVGLLGFPGGAFAAKNAHARPARAAARACLFAPPARVGRVLYGGLAKDDHRSDAV